MIAEEIASFVASARFQDLPPSAIRMARACILDTLGVALAGSQTDSSRRLQGYTGKMSPRAFGGQSTVVGAGFHTAAPLAAFCNSLSAHSIEMDDFHREGTVHPGAVVIPSVLAVGEETGCRYEDLILSVVLGYEVMIRVGIASCGSMYSRGFHPTAVCGVFGSAMAAGKLYNLSQKELASALGLAGTGASGLLEYKTSGDWSKRFQVGNAARSGVFAAGIAREGFSGPGSIFEGRYGFLSAYCPEQNPRALTPPPGSAYHIEEVSFKPYASCRFTHAPIEAFLSILNAHNLSHNDIVKVEVYTHQQAIESTMVPREKKYVPQTPVDAQFSIPYCIATAAVSRRVSPAEFEPEALRNEETLRFAGRVVAFPVKEYTALFPARNPCRVVVRTTSNIYEKELRDSLGDPENPMDEPALVSKFQSLAEGLLGETECNRLADAILRMENETPMSSLMKRLAIRQARV